MSGTDLKDLAKKIICNQVFTSWQIREGNEKSPTFWDLEDESVTFTDLMERFESEQSRLRAETIRMVFMPLAFMTPKDWEELEIPNPTFFYCPYDRTCIAAINGYPICTQVGMLGYEDEMRLHKLVVAMKKKMEEV